MTMDVKEPDVERPEGDTFGEDFALVVRKRREELGLSQKELSEKLSIRQQTVSRWENSDAIPRPRRVYELAGVLQVQASELQVLAGHLDEAPDADRVEAVDRISAKFDQLSAEDQRTVENLIDTLRGGAAQG